MWKLLKLLGLLLKALFWLALVLALAGLISLYFLERGIPSPLVARMAEACSTGDHLCRIGRATFNLKSGLHLFHVKLSPKRVAESALVTADEVVIEFSLKPRLELGERLRSVTVKNVSFPALPPKRKAQEAASQPKAPAPHQETAASAPQRMGKNLKLSPFVLTVEKANILGLLAERVTATIAVENSRVSVSQALIQWPNTAFAMSIAGAVTADFDARLVTGTAKGQAFPANVLPLLTALRARGAIKQINCFSKFERPVDADASFDINMDNSDFALRLDLNVGPCAYRNVPMKYAKGVIRAYGTNVYNTVDIGPIRAASATGDLSGRLLYRDDSESLALDAKANMDLTQLASIMNILNHGELKPIRCDTPVRVSARGIMALDSRKSTVTNDLSGKLSFKDGAIFNFRVQDVTSDLQIKGYSALFDNVSGTSLSGGKISGNVTFTFPYYSATATLFTARAKIDDVDLSDLSRIFNVTNSRVGTVSSQLLLHGHASKRTLPSLGGEGSIQVRDGLLNRMPLFAGFTDYLASNIPGVSSLVNQSSGSMDFTVRDGVLRTDNLLVEGDLFSMQGRGSCDLDAETLDFIVRANIFKEKTFAGRITRLVTLPFTRLLLEFKVFGTLKKTEWSYVNIIEKITGGLSDLSDQFKSSPAAPPPPPSPLQPPPATP